MKKCPEYQGRSNNIISAIYKFLWHGYTSKYLHFTYISIKVYRCNQNHQPCQIRVQIILRAIFPCCYSNFLSNLMQTKKRGERKSAGFFILFIFASHSDFTISCTHNMYIITSRAPRYLHAHLENFQMYVGIGQSKLKYALHF